MVGKSEGRANGQRAGTTWGWRWQRSASGRSPSLLRATVVVRTSSIVASALPLPPIVASHAIKRASSCVRRRERGSPVRRFSLVLLSRVVLREVLREGPREETTEAGSLALRRRARVSSTSRHLNRMTASASAASASSRTTRGPLSQAPLALRKCSPLETRHLRMAAR